METARNRVYRTANSEMVIAYWNVGRTIVEEEQKVLVQQIMESYC